MHPDTNCCLDGLACCAVKVVCVCVFSLTSLGSLYQVELCLYKYTVNTIFILDLSKRGWRGWFSSRYHHTCTNTLAVMASAPASRWYLPSSLTLVSLLPESVRRDKPVVTWSPYLSGMRCTMSLRHFLGQEVRNLPASCGRTRC